MSPLIEELFWSQFWWFLSHFWLSETKKFSFYLLKFTDEKKKHQNYSANRNKTKKIFYFFGYVAGSSYLEFHEWNEIAI